MSLIDSLPSQQIIAWRRHFHQHPELSFQEVQTAAYIKEVLATFPNLTITEPVENGIVAVLEGAHPGKTIALRADIDALPVTEETGLPFKSDNEGVMHACGHDAHTAMLLGAVAVLTKMQDKIAGKVKFFFQPAEEMPLGGAKMLIEAGVLDDVDEIYGCHVVPMIPSGAIGKRIGAFSANSDVFDLKIIGKGSHAMMPEAAIDPITIGAEIISTINNMVARRISPLDSAVCSFGEFTSGQAANVIPETARIQGSVRTLKQETRLELRAMIEGAIENITKMYGATYELKFDFGYSSVVNDKDCVDNVMAAATQIVGEEAIFEVPQMLGGEDFGMYTDVKPGAFFILGVGTVADGYKYINHNPKFDLDEKALPVGTAVFVNTILSISAKTLAE